MRVPLLIVGGDRGDGDGPARAGACEILADRERPLELGELAADGDDAYLERLGYSPEQAYLLLGAAPIEGPRVLQRHDHRFSGVVDIPDSCATLYLPTAIFDFDVRPSADGPQRADRGSCAMTS